MSDVTNAASINYTMHSWHLYPGSAQCQVITFQKDVKNFNPLYYFVSPIHRLDPQKLLEHKVSFSRPSLPQVYFYTDFPLSKQNNKITHGKKMSSQSHVLI